MLMIDLSAEATIMQQHMLQQNVILFNDFLYLVLL